MRVSRTIKFMAAAMLAAAPAITAQEMATAKATLKGNGIAGTVELREVANVNAPGQVVIGGRREAVVRALDYAKARGAVKVIPLSVSGAFHSSLMRPAAEGMVQHVATAPVNDPLVPVVVNCTATPAQDELSIRHELVDQVSRPVQWSNTVEFLGNQGISTFIEFGPGRVLSAIIKRMLRKSHCINVNDASTVRVEL